MRSVLLSLGFLSLLVCFSCEKEEDENPNQNIEDYYEGTWQVEINNTGVDTSFAMAVDANGDFENSLDFGPSITGDVKGSVDNNGNVTGTITDIRDGSSIGQVNGTFRTDGTANGEFVIFQDETYLWMATKL